MSAHFRRLPYLFVAFLCATRLQAQTTIPGRVLDPDGKPVANIEVLLHALTETAGSQVDRDTTREDGRFILNVERVDSGSVYFVAVTDKGQLYIGDLMSPPFQLQQEYIVRVGVNPVDMSPEAVQPAVSSPVQETDRTAGVVVIVIATLVVGSILLVAIRRRPPERRRLLVELARLEGEIGDRAGADPVLQKRRLELRKRLTGSKSG